MKKQILRLTVFLLGISLAAAAMAGCMPMNIDPMAATYEETQLQNAAEETHKTEETPETAAPETEAEDGKEPEPETKPEPQTEPETKPAPHTDSETKPEPRPTAAESAVPPDSFYVKVNCETNTVNVFSEDDRGEYTVPYRVMVCSSGLEESPTPTGTYHLTGNRWEWLELVGGVWGMYTTQITGDYLFHSVPYTEYGNHGSLQEGEFDKLGEDASHGCIRLQVDDAKWIYDNMERIRGVEIYNSPDPGPMGKPYSIKISERAYPGWDPTDQVEGNPWHRVPNS